MKPFKLEAYLTKHEFSSPYLLCCSDAQSFTVQEILDLASPEDRSLWDQLSLNYTEPLGHPLLRAQIASTLYPGLGAENIFCTAGAEEAIFASLHVLCNPGDHFIVLTPCYQSLIEIPREKGAEVTALVLREDNDWRVDLEAIKGAIKANTKGLVINFPHNPTGQVITKDELNDLIRICAAHDLWLFSDEVYRLLGTPQEPLAEPAACLYPKAISLGVMSKAYGMAGLRIGWIACQDTAILAQIKLMKDYLSICNSAPSEILGLIALKNQETILTRNNQIVSTNLPLLDAFMADHHDLFSWVRPQGGCIGFIHYKGKGSVDDFCADLLQKKGVLLMPASIYDHPGAYFRIGFGRKNMPECLEKFKEFLSE